MLNNALSSKHPFRILFVSNNTQNISLIRHKITNTHVCTIGIPILGVST